MTRNAIFLASLAILLVGCTRHDQFDLTCKRMLAVPPGVSEPGTFDRVKYAVDLDDRLISVVGNEQLMTLRITSAEIAYTDDYRDTFMISRDYGLWYVNGERLGGCEVEPFTKQPQRIF